VIPGADLRHQFMDIRPDLAHSPWPDYEARFPVFTILVGGVTPPFVMRLPTMRSRQGAQIVHATEAAVRDVARFLLEEYDWASYSSTGDARLVVDVYRNDDEESRILHLTRPELKPGLPRIDSIAPAFGGPGHTLAITGQNFGFSPEEVTVRLGETFVDLVTSVDDTLITGRVPRPYPYGGGQVDVVVSTPAGTGTLARGFTYPFPTEIHSVTPSGGPVGTRFTITGRHFYAPLGAPYFGSRIAVGSSVIETQITGAVPAAPSPAGGPVDVRVQSPSGDWAILPGAWTYPPAAQSLAASPGAHPPVGGVMRVEVG
jgi:IPT/TIG domain